LRTIHGVPVGGSELTNVVVEIWCLRDEGVMSAPHLVCPFGVFVRNVVGPQELVPVPIGCIEVGGMLVELHDVSAILGDKLGFALSAVVGVQTELAKEIGGIVVRFTAGVDSLLDVMGLVLIGALVPRKRSCHPSVSSHLRWFLAKRCLDGWCVEGCGTRNPNKSKVGEILAQQSKSTTNRVRLIVLGRSEVMGGGVDESAVAPTCRERWVS